MESITLNIGNECEALPVLQAAVAAFLRAIGAEARLFGHLELAVEEIFTNILSHNYLPGQKERIQATLGVDHGMLAITMRFKGIPFDVDALRQCADDSPGDMLAADGRGLGLRLIQRIMDRVDYRNLGKEGQEIRLFRAISAPGDSGGERGGGGNAGRREAKDLAFHLRRMAPSEAATVSKLAYLAYDYSYTYGQLYDPQKVRALNEEGQLISFVVESEGAGVIGHFALSRDENSELLEMCAGFTDPRFRGGGAMNAMAVHGIEQARQLGAAGVFVIAVTTHPYSQRAALAHGLKETALFVSCVQGLQMRAIREEAPARESVIFMTRGFASAPRVHYPPPGHRDMLERICRHAGIEATLAECPHAPPLPESGEFSEMTDDYSSGHHRVTRYGADSLEHVRRTLRRWRLDRLETVFLYLPLTQPHTAVLCQAFEEMEFFFSGLRPGRAGQDWLVLQYLNNQRHDYGQLKAASAFGQELIEYVRRRDPAQRMEAAAAREASENAQRGGAMAAG